jgi:hypothetical protein
MAEFKFSCPACGQNITCDSGFAGKESQCPACRRYIIIPHPASAVALPPHSEPVIQIKVSTLKRAAVIFLCLVLAGGLAVFAYGKLNKVTVLHGNEHFNSRQAYRPPIEITIVAKTDSTNLRLSYTARQIIFNWEMNPTQLRVDGGPANGQHKDGAGQIPKDKYVTIRWLVTTTHEAIYVNGQLRFEHDGDYSQIVRRVSIFPANGSTVTVKSMTIKPISNSAR